MARHANEDGFALLEALIATAIFAMLLGALHGGLRTGWRAWGKANSEDAAIAIAKSVIAGEGVEAPLAPGTRSGLNNGIAWRSQVTPYDDNGNLRPGLSGFWVRVDVSWREGGRGTPQHSLALTSLKLARGGAQAAP